MGADTVLINTYKLQRKGTATAAGSRQPAARMVCYVITKFVSEEKLFKGTTDKIWP